MSSWPGVAPLAALERSVSAEDEATARRVRRWVRRISYVVMGLLLVVVLGTGLPLPALFVLYLLGGAILLPVTVLVLLSAARSRVAPARNVLHWAARYGRWLEADDRPAPKAEVPASDEAVRRRAEAEHLVNAAVNAELAGADPIVLLVQAHTVLGDQVREFWSPDDVRFRRRSVARGAAILVVGVAVLVVAAVAVARWTGAW